MNFLDRLSGDIIIPKIATGIEISKNNGDVNFSMINQFDNPNSPFGEIHFQDLDLPYYKWLKTLESPAKDKVLVNFFGMLGQSGYMDLKSYTFRDLFGSITNSEEILTLTPNQILDCIRLHKSFLYDKINGRKLSFIFLIKLQTGFHIINASNMDGYIYMWGRSFETTDIRTDQVYVLPNTDNINQIRIKSRK